jgi:hypothetical protein
MKKRRFDEGAGSMPDGCDMKNLPTLALLLSAVAVSAEPANSPAVLKYDRLAVSYADGSGTSGTRSFGVTGAALLGDRFIVGGSVSTYKLKALDAAGPLVTFDLGYKFTLEQGDLIVTTRYGQAQVSRGFGANSANSADLQADEISTGLTWRQEINQSFEYSLGYSYVITNVIINAPIGGARTRFSREIFDSVGSLGFRYNVNANVDISLGFSFGSGKQTWSLSTGYNF